MSTVKLIQLKQSDIPGYRKHILRKYQNGKCAISGVPPKRPVLDHHHKKRIKGTGRVRGVIDSNMNVFLAKIENNASRYGIDQKELPRILRNIAKYLEKPQYPYIHPSEKPPAKLIKKSSFNKLVKALKSSNYRGKLPVFPVAPRGKPGKQKLTKALEKLYDRVDIKPEFYGDKN
jgi:hypothetical protein